MIGVKAGSWVPSSRYPSGWLSITSVSRRDSFSCSTDDLDLLSDLYNIIFVNPAILLKNTPHLGLLDKLNLHYTSSLASMVLVSAFC